MPTVVVWRAVVLTATPLHSAIPLHSESRHHIDHEFNNSDWFQHLVNRGNGDEKNGSRSSLIPSWRGLPPSLSLGTGEFFVLYIFWVSRTTPCSMSTTRVHQPRAILTRIPLDLGFSSHDIHSLGTHYHGECQSRDGEVWGKGSHSQNPRRAVLLPCVPKPTCGCLVLC